MEAFEIVLIPLLGALDWFVDILSASNALPFYLGFFLIGVVVRFFVSPFIGSRSNSGSGKGDD